MDAESKRQQFLKSKEQERKRKLRETQRILDWPGIYDGTKEWEAGMDAYIEHYNNGMYNSDASTQTDPWRPWDSMTYKRKHSSEDIDWEPTAVSGWEPVACGGWTDPSASASWSDKRDVGTQTNKQRSTRDGKQGDINSKIDDWCELVKKGTGCDTKADMQKHVDFAKELIKKK